MRRHVCLPHQRHSIFGLTASSASDDLTEVESRSLEVRGCSLSAMSKKNKLSTRKKQHEYDLENERKAKEKTLKKNEKMDNKMKVGELQAQIVALLEEIDDVSANCASWKLQCLNRGRESQVLAGRLAAITQVLDGETVQSLQAEVGRLREEVARSEALRLSMVRFQTEQGGSWVHMDGGSSKTSLQLSKAGSSRGSQWEAGRSPPGSPGTPQAGLLQELLDIGEATLQAPVGLKAEVHILHEALEDAEQRASEALTAVEEQRQRVEEVEKEKRGLQEALEDEKLRCNALANEIVRTNEILSAERERARAELAAERARSSEEGEDLIQEMAELRFRSSEIVEQERELRAEAEGASLRRVQELEAQLVASRVGERRAVADRESALKRLEETRGLVGREEETRQAQESRLISVSNEVQAAHARVADLEAELAALQANQQDATSAADVAQVEMNTWHEGTGEVVQLGGCDSQIRGLRFAAAEVRTRGAAKIGASEGGEAEGSGATWHGMDAAGQDEVNRHQVGKEARGIDSQTKTHLGSEDKCLLSLINHAKKCAPFLFTAPSSAS